ncbi:cysteine methyltransferase [Candidatus Saccharibacteria bacterium]|nr:MAG: cysteine methyltransferase [Candidatus Saccharibacteria bacterium]
MPDSDFRARVYDLVAQIPEGRVMTYGDIAAMCGQARASRIVGGLAHFGPTELPWHRVVNRFGDCASGYYGGKEGHKQALEAEGFIVIDYRITDFTERRWRP